ncbi:hypothetical protein RND71_013271 [Anisodus tanguticus]|uniref:Uncharacterized protein n=1 Tax=Anisodus tanguticus TaxID=243964 RepID=A0AAE1SEV9_9SOLA|nr:hypothetical protein RND71_013271 [Anisodus tanguticus]
MLRCCYCLFFPTAEAFATTSSVVATTQILRWLAAKSNTKLRVDLFNPFKDDVVHISLVPTVGELMKSFLASFVPLESETDILIDQFKVELAGVTVITKKSSGDDGVDGATGDCVGVGSSGVINRGGVVDGAVCR